MKARRLPPPPSGVVTPPPAPRFPQAAAMPDIDPAQAAGLVMGRRTGEPLRFKPGEKERLIAEALATRGVTVLPPGAAIGASYARPSVADPLGFKVDDGAE